MGGGAGYTGVTKPSSYYKATIAYIFILCKRYNVHILNSKMTAAKTLAFWARQQLYLILNEYLINFHVLAVSYFRHSSL